MVKLKAAARATPSRPFTRRQVGQDEADEAGVEAAPRCFMTPAGAAAGRGEPCRLVPCRPLPCGVGAGTCVVRTVQATNWSTRARELYGRHIPVHRCNESRNSLAAACRRTLQLTSGAQTVREWKRDNEGGFPCVEIRHVRTLRAPRGHARELPRRRRLVECGCR